MKTKIRILAAAMLTACVSQAYSQSPVYIGVQGGISIPNLQSGSDGPEISNGYSSRFGPHFGLFGEFSLTNKFSLQPEINYSAQGGKKDGVQAIPASQFNPNAPAGTYMYANFKSEAKLNYIEVPVLAKFTFPLGSHFNFIADAGPYVGFLVEGKNVTSGSSKVYADKQETQPVSDQVYPFGNSDDIKDELHTANFGIQGGIGLSYNLGKGYLFAHGGGNYGLMKIQKDKQYGQNNTGAATAVLGYALRIN